MRLRKVIAWGLGFAASSVWVWSALGLPGEILDSFAVPSGVEPVGLAASGAEIYVLSRPGGGGSNEIVLTDSAGTELNRLNLAAGDFIALAHDGTSIWALAADRQSIHRLNAGGVSVASFASTISHGIAYDRGEDRIWDLEGFDGASGSTAIRRRDRNGVVDRTIQTTASHARWFGLAFDGCSLWTSNRADQTLYRLNPFSGAVVGRYGAPSSNTIDLAFDGTDLLMTSTAADTIYRMEIGDVSINGSPCTPGFGMPAVDAGVEDGGVEDVGFKDAGLVDAGGIDSGAGPMDAGAATDAGRRDNGMSISEFDATPRDLGAMGSEDVDGGLDASMEPEDGGCTCQSGHGAPKGGMALFILLVLLGALCRTPVRP